MKREVNCSLHGKQGIALVCTHIAHAVDAGKKVGFFWGDDTDTGRPDAWCLECELALRALPKGAASDKWFLACDNKIFCVACWDDAKRICGGFN
jgi:hypothetical protein